jgi:hypothetical protein
MRDAIKGAALCSVLGLAASGCGRALKSNSGSSAGATWAGTVQVGTSADDEAFDVAIDAAGAIYVAGRTGGAFAGASSSGLEDMLIAAFDSTGVMTWSAQLGSIKSDSVERIAVLPDGTTLVAGYAMDAAAGPGSALGSTDYVVARFGPGGRRIGSSSRDRASTTGPPALPSIRRAARLSPG